jgi:hypothetical protein
MLIAKRVGSRRLIAIRVNGLGVDFAHIILQTLRRPTVPWNSGLIAVT